MLPALSSLEIKVLTHEPNQSGNLAEMSLSLKSLTSNVDGHNTNSIKSEVDASHVPSDVSNLENKLLELGVQHDTKV